MLNTRIAVISVLLIGAPVACAEDITVWGSSTGTVVGIAELGFSGSSFSATTINGAASFTGSNSLGSFYLPAGSSPAGGGRFTLSVTLTSPAGLAAEAPVIRTFTGTISPDGDGGVSIHFTKPSAKVAFDGGGISGSFSISLADVSVQQGHIAPLIGVLTGTQELNTACRLNFLAARADPAVLSTPNQQMMPVLIRTVASDKTGCAFSCRIESVTSNEPGAEWQITGDLTLTLRADFLTSGNGRMYVVAVRCTDSDGNTSLQKAPVVVPRRLLPR